MAKYKNLIEKKNDLVKRAEEIVNGAEVEKRELTEDEAKELAEIRDDVKSIKDALGIMDEIGEEREEVSGDEEETKENEERSIEAEEAKKFASYIRSVVLHNRGEDVNLTKGDNGAIIPTTIANKIIAKVYDICPILEKSTQYNVKGKLVIPYYDEGTTAITVDYAQEFEDLTSSVGSFDKVELNGFLAGALVKISKSLINNNDFNLTDFVVNRMAVSIKRWLEGELLKGTNNKIAGLSGVPAGMTLTAGATTAITADEVIQLHDMVIDEYQNDAMFIMSRKTRTALRTLKTNEGVYLLNDDISTPFGTSILGKPVYVTDNMDDMGAGKVAIYYGDMSGLATKFSEEMEIEVLREKYATQHAVGVVGWLEVDAKIEDAQKIACLKMHA